MNTNEIESATIQPIPYMNTLTTCVNKLTLNGYTDSFTIINSRLHSTVHNKTYEPTDIKVTDFYRFEGQSDPGDNAILYVIETNDGNKGMIIDAFGLYADDSITKFMKHVESIPKHVDKEDKSLVQPVA